VRKLLWFLACNASKIAFSLHKVHQDLSTRPEKNVFLASRTGALLRWLLLAGIASLGQTLVDWHRFPVRLFFLKSIGVTEIVCRKLSNV
jgi:hypothetical protein